VITKTILFFCFRYGWSNWFSGQTLYNSFIYQLFNIFFASIPIMVYAIWDEEYSDEVLVKNEKKNYYEQGIKSKPHFES
jgi:phospholipid-transporting ATPase